MNLRLLRVIRFKHIIFSAQPRGDPNRITKASIYNDTGTYCLSSARGNYEAIIEPEPAFWDCQLECYVALREQGSGAVWLPGCNQLENGEVPSGKIGHWQAMGP